MPEGALALSLMDVAGAAALVLVAGVVSLGLKLKLEGSLALGVLRATVQLLAVGYALTWIFDHPALWLTALAMVVMTLAATRAALARAGWAIEGGFFGAFGTLVLTAGLTALIGSALFVGADPWYHPRYALPLLGMLLGNGLTGLSLCLDSLLGALAEDAELIEVELALGASRSEAAREPVQRAVRRGIIPIVNAMMVAGIVSLPGMMTGQILAGAEPVEAVKYQLLILFLIAASTSLACLGVAVFAVARAIDADACVRPNRLRARGS